MWSTEGKVVMEVYVRNEITMNCGWSEIEPRVSNCDWTRLCKHIYDIFEVVAFPCQGCTGMVTGW